jgi:Flp pilus assembly protein CpaB
VQEEDRTVEDRTKRRARLILIVGFLLALLASVGTFVVASGGQSAGPTAVPTTEVLVAAREIPPRTQLAAADLRAVRVNSDAVPPTALRADQQKDVVGRVNTVPIQTGELILNGKFAATVGALFTVFPPNVTADASGAIPPGTPNYRAMSITVPDQFAVGGAVQVGDLIDVMYTFNVDPNKYFLPQPGVVTGGPNDTRVADFSVKIILERVPIIARTLTVYTIRTDAATAEQLAYLQAAGAQLQFLLRAAADDRAARTEGATFEPVQQVRNFRIPRKIAP